MAELTLAGRAGRTHLVATFASTLNGCPYCTHGPAYALELHYFAERDELLPVDERQIQGWCALDDEINKNAELRRRYAERRRERAG